MKTYLMNGVKPVTVTDKVYRELIDAKILHQCPFKCEIREDYTTLCNCDEQREHECAEEV